MISHTDQIDGLTPERLLGFFEGWPTKPSAEMHLRTLRGSEVAVLAVEAGTDRLVGFVTAIGDGVLSAYRGQGIGTELGRRVLERLARRYMIDLACNQELMPFYERMGMTPGRAMMLRDRSGLITAKEAR